MAQKILVSKPGKNVLTATSLDDFYLHSDYPLLKVHSSGTFTIDSDGGSVGTDITHNLGYYPQAIVFSQLVEDDGTVTSQYFQHDWDILLGGEIYGYTNITTTILQIRVGAPVNGDRDVLGFYYILKEDIT